MSSNTIKFSYHAPARDVESLKATIVSKLIYNLCCEPSEAKLTNWLNAALYTVRDLSAQSRLHTRRAIKHEKSRRVYYLSMEFLMGRAFSNAMIAENVYEAMKQAFKELGLDLEDILNQEEDPGLGNGGLGRLAACFLDSLATLRIPATGYGIRYDYGMFKQEIENGRQVEKPDGWLAQNIAWEFNRPSKKIPIRFGGQIYYENNKCIWKPSDEVVALGYDQLVPGYDNDVANTLRLWSAQSSDAFSLNDFNRGDYFAAMEKQNFSENVSRVLYPDDSTTAGRELRLRQEHFLTSASIQDILRRHLDIFDNLDNLAEKVAIHLNDTHPVLAIPELMRLLIDENGYEWNKAWEMCRNIFSYTNHTLMSEALETWPIEMLGSILPRHLQLILEINEHFLNDLRAQGYGEDFIRRVSIIDEDNGRRVRMAWLAVIGSYKINGVAKIHSDLMVKSIFADFAKIYPERFTNVTNGVTPRRWIAIANPELAKLIDSKIGKNWRKELDELSQLNQFVDDEAFLSDFQRVKFSNKQRLAEYIKYHLGIEVNPKALFDVQVKRIHEYKRQLLNVLHIIYRYNQILKNPDADWTPRVFIFAGKAASAYHTAKKIINLINDVAEVINNDGRIKDLIKVVFIPNYGVSLAQIIIPAADVSEQISLAGTEASGTSNMKFALNGALTVGTLDGANVEILNMVGKENIFIFGNTVEQVEALRAKGYSPFEFFEREPELNTIIQQITSGHFSLQDPMRYQNELNLFSDYYQVMADFRAYVEIQKQVDQHYKQPQAWAKSALINTANMGYFSSDRSIIDYAENIWKVEPLLSYDKEVYEAENCVIEDELPEQL
ncbi:glycogen/starch/alpha-glucan phosphorylase [Gallibacterium anatis]|uniref:glycogen/starch/alpha-glucan phosphorylase n=1 Tax=Gallibacterium anatis TaxID=750 RepID=UPI00057D6E20|nr:glycogen/starch/alpha-glucan phosphorylase [Gallibacterium anatis]